MSRLTRWLGRSRAGVPEDFDRGYFTSCYRDYAAQNPPRKLAFYRDVVERLAPDRRPLRLLDVGCGLGAFVGFLRQGDPDSQRFELCGTDISAHAVAQVRTTWPALEVRQASATEQPFAAASFDVITAFDVIEHVAELAAVARAIQTMLVPGGLFTFVVPVYDGASGPIITALDRDPTHIHKYRRDFWLDWARQHFQILDWWGTLRYLLPGGLYLHVATQRFRRHTPAILIAARNG